MNIATTTVTEPFNYDVPSALERYEAVGYIHESQGVSKELMSVITDQIAELMGSGEHELEGWRYPEKKEQFLWQLPDGLSIETLCAAVAKTTGMNPETTVLSERHLKVYSATAPEMPPPHKDRSASTVTVGIGVDIPAESRLVLWPETETSFNIFPTAAEWRNTRHEEEMPEVVTAGIAPVEIDLRAGDVVMFRGANFYHERHMPARTAVLYLKFNDRGLDPLGEDPRTVEAESRSVRLADHGISATTGVAVSPRLISLRTEDLLPDLGVVRTARLFGAEAGVRITTEEADVLGALARSGRVTVAEAGAEVSMIERLVKLGLVVLS